MYLLLWKAVNKKTPCVKIIGLGLMLFVTKPYIFCTPCKPRVCKFPKNSMDVNYMDRYHPYHFLEICIPPVNKPIRSYQVQHLKLHILVFSHFSFPVGNFSDQLEHPSRACHQSLADWSWCIPSGRTWLRCTRQARLHTLCYMCHVLLILTFGS